ncbi:MAG: FliO/MopB family protein [Thermodesulfobacteriota bacterium]
MTGDYLYMLLRSVLALGLVVALIIGAMYALRRISHKRGASAGALPISVISRAFMGQKSSIAIVDVAGEVLVLGVSQNAVNLLLRLEDPEVIRDLRAAPHRGGLGIGKLLERGLPRLKAAGKNKQGGEV